MTQPEYEQKRAECWRDTANVCQFDTEDVLYRQAFNAAFDRAYALGTQFGNSEQVKPGSTSSAPSLEPSFKPGDIVRYIPTGVIEVICCKTGRQYYHLKGWQKDVHVDDLEPYTAPKEQSANLSQNIANCDKFPNRDLCDKLIQRGFAAHNRLHLAAMAMAGILANENTTSYNELQDPAHFDYVVFHALAYADALIAEAEKSTAI